MFWKKMYYIVLNFHNHLFSLQQRTNSMVLATNMTSRALISNLNSLWNCYMTWGNALKLSELTFSCLFSVGNTVAPIHRTAVRSA